MKKGISILVCFLLMITMVGSTIAESTITPRYAYVASISASLSISSGVARAVGAVIPYPAMDTTVSVRLQRENSAGRWTTIATWSGSGDGGKAEAGGTKTITSGYKYQVYVIAKVYDSSGNVVETVTKYSGVETY